MAMPLGVRPWASGEPPVGPERQPEAEADGDVERAPTAQKGGEGTAPREAADWVVSRRGGGGSAPVSLSPGANSRRQELPRCRPATSVPVVLLGSCHHIPGLAPVPQTTAAATAGTASPSISLSDGPPLPPLHPGGGRPCFLRHRNQQPRNPAPGAGSLHAQALLLLLLVLLQIVLGCTTMPLNFGVLSLSSAPQVTNACPFWASFLVILCGLVGIMTWKKPIMVLANLFVLLSVTCCLLNITGYILGHQGIQFVSSVPRCDSVDMGENKICLCCKEFQPTKCREEAVLKLYHVKSCSFAFSHLKKLLFARCALSAFTTIVCLSAAVLRYLHIFAARRSYLGETQTEDQAQVLDPEDFIPPVPPPSYFTTSYSRALPMSCRVQIRGADVFSPVDLPPPYEAVQSQNSCEQEDAVQASVLGAARLGEESDRQSSQDLCYSDDFSDNDIPYYSGEEIPESSSRVSLSLSNASLLPAEEGRRSFHPLKKWSKSDPVLHCQFLQGMFSSVNPIQSDPYVLPRPRQSEVLHC